jgi:hypothetical protein
MTKVGWMWFLESLRAPMAAARRDLNLTAYVMEGHTVVNSDSMLTNQQEILSL